MTYEEIISRVEGKPIDSSLTVKLGGGGTVKIDGVFPKSLEPTVIRAAFETDTELSFRGKPEVNEGQGTRQTWKARQFRQVIDEHFGLVKQESKSKGAKGKGSGAVGNAGEPAEAALVNA